MKWSILWKRWVRLGLLTSRATGAKSERPEPSSGVAVVGTGIAHIPHGEPIWISWTCILLVLGTVANRCERSVVILSITKHIKTVQLQMRAHPFSTFRVNFHNDTRESSAGGVKRVKRLVSVLTRRGTRARGRAWTTFSQA